MAVIGVIAVLIILAQLRSGLKTLQLLVVKFFRRFFVKNPKYTLLHF